MVDCAVEVVEQSLSPVLHKVVTVCVKFFCRPLMKVSVKEYTELAFLEELGFSISESANTRTLFNNNGFPVSNLM